MQTRSAPLGVEKMSYGGRRHYITWVYHGQGVDFAIELEFLEHHFKKLKATACACGRSRTPSRGTIEVEARWWA